VPRRLPLLLACLAGVLASGCDVGASVDLDAPAHEPGVAVRATLAAGAAPTVRLSLSRDPYGPADGDLPSATPPGATVTLWRDGRLVETLAARPQTCYTRRETRCNPETGATELVAEEGAYPCGAFGGALPVESGGTYTVRAEVPGYPTVEATVVVPAAASVMARETAGPDAETRRLVVDVTDPPAADTRYGIVVFREFDRFDTQACAVGGPRDTTVVLGFAARTGTRFHSTDPVLTANAVAPPDGFRLATFTDATFAGGTAALTVDVPRASTQTALGFTGGLVVQVAVLSETLYDAYQTTGGLPLGDNPFAEPANLPSNVAGGYGRLGAVAFAEASVP